MQTAEPASPLSIPTAPPGLLWPSQPLPAGQAFAHAVPEARKPSFPLFTSRVLTHLLALSRILISSGSLGPHPLGHTLRMQCLSPSQPLSQFCTFCSHLFVRLFPRCPSRSLPEGRDNMDFICFCLSLYPPNLVPAGNPATC